MSRLSNLQKFGSYEVVDREFLSDTEKAEISKITIKERTTDNGDKFLVMCFLYKNGNTASEYLSSKSDLEKGDAVKIESAHFLTLKDANGKLHYRADGSIE
jgi:hypothetical protein